MSILQMKESETLTGEIRKDKRTRALFNMK